MVIREYEFNESALTPLTLKQLNNFRVVDLEHQCATK